MNKLFSFKIVRNSPELDVKIMSTPFISCLSYFMTFLYGHYLGYKEEEFSWPSYLKACKAQAAPKSLFENQNTVSTHLLLVV